MLCFSSITPMDREVKEENNFVYKIRPGSSETFYAETVNEGIAARILCFVY